MYFVSIGGIEVNGVFHLFKFFKMAISMRKQALATAGNVSVDLFRYKRVFFVVSVWNSAADMAVFARAGEHGEIMRKGSKVIKSAINLHFTAEKVPSRAEAVSCWQESLR